MSRPSGYCPAFRTVARAAFDKDVGEQEPTPGPVLAVHVEGDLPAVEVEPGQGSTARAFSASRRIQSSVGPRSRTVR